MSGLSCRSCQVWVRAVTCHTRSNGCSEDVRPVRDGPTVPIQFLYLDIYVIIYIYVYTYKYLYSIHEHIYICVYYILHIDRYIYIYVHYMNLCQLCHSISVRAKWVEWPWFPRCQGVDYDKMLDFVTRPRCKAASEKAEPGFVVILCGQPCYMLPLKIQTSYPTYIETCSL